MFHSGQNRIQQSSQSKIWQSLGVAVATTKFLFGTSVCTVDSAVGKSDFSLVLDILHVSPGMDCNTAL